MPLAPPATLTPTKATAFSDCPFAFRRSVIDGVRTPPTRPLAVGTLVHAALEDFYRREPNRRSEAALDEAVDTAVRAAACDDELGAYVAELDDRERAALYRSITTLSRTILDLEDPARVRAIGTELRLEATIEGVHVRGVIDRLDLDDEGDLVVVDYKTGRTPPPSHQDARLGGVLTYALLVSVLFGRVPRLVRLVYLGDGSVIERAPSAQMLRGVATRLRALWHAIERACDREDFPPRPSRLCGSCPHRDVCPTMGAAR